MDSSINTVMTQRTQSQSGPDGSLVSIAASLLAEADDLWTKYMSSSEDTTDEVLHKRFRTFENQYSKGRCYEQLEEGSVDTSGPLIVYAKADHRLKARRIYHAYGEKSEAMFGVSGPIWNHMSTQLSEHAKSFNSDSLEGFRKVPLTHAILSLADHLPAPGARCEDFPSEIYRELLGLFTPDKVHRGDPKEKAEK
jgi:hypothetical protein